jgi:hypothetical protein
MSIASDSATITRTHELPSQADDAALERRIECARIAMTLAKDAASQRDHLERMTRLIAQRSPRQIEKMERAMGLRN